MMSFCKIVLIVLMAFKSIMLIIESSYADGPVAVKNFIGIIIAWLLYWGAGLLTF